ncbi:MAG TPA: xanthine dehydrogenase family protein molybdopterin-binding subunit [bacterium]|nr:xanthine dehydrogenase family protein molybdopterin-binding subunit [bacterium]
MALTIVGQSLPRVDAQEKLTGRTVFTGDQDLRGLLHGRLVLSPHAHATIRRIPVDVAKVVPGVVAVLTAAELPFGDETPNARGRCLLARGETRFPGEPVAAVLAESEGAAADGAARLAAAIEYDALPALIDPVAAADRSAPLVQPGLQGASSEAGAHGAAAAAQEEEEKAPGNVASQVKFARGDIERGLRESAVVVRRTFRTAVVHQAYIEPHATIADFDRGARRLTVWTPTQGLFYTREQTASVLGLPESSVRIVPMPVGGGFGGKILLLEPIAGALAMVAGRPVRLVLTRAEEFQTATPAPQSILEVALGASSDGEFRALQARLLFDAGALPGAPVTICGLLMGGAYRVANLDIRGREVLTHKPPQGAYRAPGSVQAAFAIESVVDEIAEALGQDPLELRVRNVSQEGDPMPDGGRWPRIGLRESLLAVRESRLWRERPRRGGAKTRRADGTLAGTGIAVGGWLGGLEAASACIRPNPDGTIHVVVGSVDISGSATSLAQIAAETIGVPMQQVRLVPEDSDGAPQSGMSGGSKIIYTVGSAVQKAAADARRQILALAAKRLEVAEADLDIVDGTVRVRGVPSRAVAVADVIKMTSGFGAQHAPVFGVASEAITTRSPGFAAHVAAVEVDPDSGRVRVTGYAAAQDVGRAINPALVQGQIQGGVAQGIGWALFEQMVYDEAGTLTTGTFADYALPRSTDVPPVDVHLVEVPSARGPFGAKGVGEPPVVPVSAAIANAITDASGARFDSLPITPERVVAAIAERRR